MKKKQVMQDNSFLKMKSYKENRKYIEEMTSFMQKRLNNGNFLFPSIRPRFSQN